MSHLPPIVACTECGALVGGFHARECSWATTSAAGEQYMPPTEVKSSHCQPCAKPTPHTKGFSEGEAMNFREFQRINEARIPAFGPNCENWRPMEWGCALAEEAGEVCGVLKKRARTPHPTLAGHDITGKPNPTLSDLGEELADVLTYAFIIASRHGIDLNNALRLKWNKVSEKVNHPVRI